MHEERTAGAIVSGRRRTTRSAISLRTMFGIVAIVATAILTLKNASGLWLSVVMGITATVTLAGLIVAAVDRGATQAFALGATIVILGYGLITAIGPSTDMV